MFNTLSLSTIALLSTTAATAQAQNTSAMVQAHDRAQTTQADALGVLGSVAEVAGF